MLVSLLEELKVRLKQEAVCSVTPDLEEALLNYHIHSTCFQAYSLCTGRQNIACNFPSSLTQFTLAISLRFKVSIFIKVYGCNFAS